MYTQKKKKKRGKCMSQHISDYNNGKIDIFIFLTRVRSFYKTFKR